MPAMIETARPHVEQAAFEVQKAAQQKAQEAGTMGFLWEFRSFHRFLEILGCHLRHRFLWDFISDCCWNQEERSIRTGRPVRISSVFLGITVVYSDE